MRVKICGITNLTDALLCSHLGGDALGFVFYEKSKRNISYSKAREIIQRLSPFIVKVGIFVDQSADEINSISHNVGLNAVQLYGDTAQSMINEIHLPVIKCFKITSDFDFSVLERYTNCSFLLDTYSEEALGGTGKSFNWEIIPIKLQNKIILAGGISIDNIEYLYHNIQPVGIDLSSSVESSPGKKDENKLKDFFYKMNKLRYTKC